MRLKRPLASISMPWSDDAGLIDFEQHEEFATFTNHLGNTRDQLCPFANERVVPGGLVVSWLRHRYFFKLNALRTPDDRTCAQPRLFGRQIGNRKLCFKGSEASVFIFARDKLEAVPARVKGESSVVPQ